MAEIPCHAATGSNCHFLICQLPPYPPHALTRAATLRLEHDLHSHCARSGSCRRRRVASQTEARTEGPPSGAMVHRPAVTPPSSRIRCLLCCVLFACFVILLDLRTERRRTSCDATLRTEGSTALRTTGRHTISRPGRLKRAPAPRCGHMQ